MINNRVVSINYHKWRGIHSAAIQHFQSIRLIDRRCSRRKANKIAAEIVQNFDCAVIQGLPEPFASRFVTTVKKISPSFPILCIWHGNFMQCGENNDWEMQKRLQKLHQERLIDKIGFVKAGMAETFRKIGADAYFCMNKAPENHPTGTTTLTSNNTDIGIFSVDADWRKTPYSMIAATLHLPNPMVHMAKPSHRAIELAKHYQIPTQLRDTLVPSEEMPTVLGSMDINLYVTMSECAPMLPLESLAAGTPCLTGRNHHYFRENEFLRSRLVVDLPDSEADIGMKATQALAERDKIIQQYKLYSREYNQAAEESMQLFVGQTGTR